MKRRIAIYCRTTSPVAEVLREQEIELFTHALRTGHRVVGVFSERASGQQPNRPGRARVLGLARDRRIDAVLVSAPDRWSRCAADMTATLAELDADGVSLIGMSDLAVTTAKLTQEGIHGLSTA